MPNGTWDKVMGSALLRVDLLQGRQGNRRQSSEGLVKGDNGLPLQTPLWGHCHLTELWPICTESTTNPIDLWAVRMIHKKVNLGSYKKKKSNSSHGSDKFLGAGKTLWSKGALQGKK